MVTAQDVTWVTEPPVVSTEAVEGTILPWKRITIDLSYTQGDDAEKFDMSMAMKQAWDNLAQSNLNGIFQVDFDGYIADIHFVQWKEQYYFLAYGADSRELPVITEDRMLVAFAFDWIVLGDKRVQRFAKDVINTPWKYTVNRPKNIINCDEYDFRPLIGKKIWKNRTRGI